MSVSNSVLRFAKLKKFFDLFTGRKRLDCNAESLLEKIMLNWDEGLSISTNDLIFSSSEIGSESILRTCLAELVALGFIEPSADQNDPNVEIHVPTKETIQYYEALASYLEKCFDVNSEQTEDPVTLLANSGVISQSYLNAQSEALLAYSKAIESIQPQKSLEKLATDVCKAITSGDLYICAWIGIAKLDSSAMIEAIASEGVAKAYGDNLSLSWDPNNTYGAGPTGVAIRSGRAVVVSDINMAVNFGPWVNRAKEFGIQSTLSVPLFSDNKPIGVLIVYARLANSFGPVEIHLFEKLGAKLVATMHQR